MNGSDEFKRIINKNRAILKQKPLGDVLPELHPTEYKLNVAVAKHINSVFIGTHNPNLKWWHIANETRSSADAFFGKQKGVLPGVSDLMFGWPCDSAIWKKIISFLLSGGLLPKIFRLANTGVIELKKPGEPLSGNQNKFISWADSIEWHTGEARSVREVHNILIGWGLHALHHSVIEPDYRTDTQKQLDIAEMYRR